MNIHEVEHAVRWDRLLPRTSRPLNRLKHRSLAVLHALVRHLESPIESMYYCDVFDEFRFYFFKSYDFELRLDVANDGVVWLSDVYKYTTKVYGEANSLNYEKLALHIEEKLAELLVTEEGG